MLDEWSASASELLAGALQDAHAATIVGRVSFGKGSVQTILDLPGGAGIKLTTARYYTPAGHAIQGDGIHPEVEVLEAKRKTSDFPGYTERDLTGALPPDPSAPPPRPPVAPQARVETGSAPEDLASRRTVPNDPRTGDDPLLKVAFERLLKR
jgi:carboxyl-terminal processing protease